MVKYLGFTRQDHRGFDLEMTFFLFFREIWDYHWESSAKKWKLEGN